MTIFYMCEGVAYILGVWLAFALADKLALQRYSDMVTIITRTLVTAGLGGIAMFGWIMDYQAMEAIPMLLSTIIVAASIIWLYRIDWYEGIFAVFLYRLTMVIVDNMIHWSLQWTSHADEFRLTEIGGGRSLYLLLMVPLMILWKEVSAAIIQTVRIPVFCAYLVLGIRLLMASAKVYGEPRSTEYFLCWMGVFAIIALMAGGVTAYVQKRFRENRVQLRKMKMEMLEENYRQVLQMYQEKATLLHDEKHHIRMLKEMLRAEAYEEAQKLLNDVDREIIESGTRVWSNHQMLDLLLNMKVGEAKKHEIDVEIRVDEMSNLFMKEADICVLFSNLLDNAIEANLKIKEPEKRRICLIGERKGDLLIIKLSNAVNEPVVLTDGQLVTTKEDKHVHGFGMESVKHVLKKYHGEYTITVSAKEFELVLFLVGFQGN